MHFPYEFTIGAFFAEFPENDKAVEYLFEKGILKSISFCGRCDKQMNIQIMKTKVDGHVIRCCKCKATKSVRKGTFLEKSKISAKTFLLFLYFWTNNSSIAQLRTFTALSEKTCVEYANFLREIASWKFENEDRKLGGIGHVVQIDESVIYRAKYNRGHALLEPTKWIFGMWDVTQEVGACFFVPDRSAETLLPLIKDHILPGSEIHSDLWRAYSRISNIDVVPAYTHKTVNHSLFFKDIETGVHTNNIEAYWGSVKSTFKKLRGTSRALTASYLDFHMYKERFGQSPKILFDQILSDIENKFLLE
jgi:hypothetical protein